MSSYEELKRQRDRALVESIHGPLDGANEPSSTSGSPEFDGGARIDYNAQRPHSQEGVFVHPRDEIGWGNAIEFEDAAALLFPHLDLGDD